MAKTTVHYDREKGVMEDPSGGVILWPADHPDSENVSNASYALTSPIVEMDTDSGIVETKNTIYKPHEKEK